MVYKTAEPDDDNYGDEFNPSDASEDSDASDSDEQVESGEDSADEADRLAMEEISKPVEEPELDYDAQAAYEEDRRMAEYNATLSSDSDDEIVEGLPVDPLIGEKEKEPSEFYRGMIPTDAEGNIRKECRVACCMASCICEKQPMKGCAAKQRICGECTGKEAELLEQQAQRAKDRELKLAAEAAAAAEAAEKERLRIEALRANPPEPGHPDWRVTWSDEENRYYFWHATTREVVWEMKVRTTADDEKEQREKDEADVAEIRARLDELVAQMEVSEGRVKRSRAKIQSSYLEKGGRQYSELPPLHEPELSQTIDHVLKEQASKMPRDVLGGNRKLKGRGSGGREKVVGRQPSSAFRGVWLLSLSSGKEVYESWIWYGQKKHSVGRFDSEEAAAKAYDVLAAEHHGSKAGGPQLNFGADGSRNPYKQSGGGSAAEGTIKERAKRKIQGLYGENGANILANQPGGSEPVQRLPKFKPQRRAGAAKAVSGVSRLMSGFGGSSSHSGVVDRSIYRGVEKAKDGRWACFITHNKVRQALGTFDDEIEAATTYDDEARRLRGSKAKLNFPGANERGGTADQRAAQSGSANRSNQFAREKVAEMEMSARASAMDQLDAEPVFEHRVPGITMFLSENGEPASAV